MTTSARFVERHIMAAVVGVNCRGHAGRGSARDGDSPADSNKTFAESEILYRSRGADISRA